MLFPTINETTHAEGDEPDDGIAITVNNEVSANLVLFDEGDYKIAKDTVTVSSSAPYGYELFLTTDSEAHQSIYLNDDPTSSSVISPVSGTIAEPAVLTSNTWGFAIAGQGNFDNEYDPANPDPASRFAIIPTADNQQAVFENNAATAEDDIDFYYGIKVEPTLEVGEYTTSAEYTATAKLPPLTAKAILGDNGNLNFVYDRNTYTVGETYTDNIGETEISAIYSVPMESSEDNEPGWVSNNDILTANFGDSFRGFKPLSTAFWFNNDRYLNTITGTTNLDTSPVVNMSAMFYNAGYKATSFNLDLSSLDTGNVVNMSGMFGHAGQSATTWSIGDISDWNTDNVINMSSMFALAGRRAPSFILDLSGWNTGNVVNMSGMFDQSGSTTAWSVGDISGWNVSKVENMSFMFQDVGSEASFSMDLSGWNTGNVTNMYRMFSGIGSKASISLNLSGWNTSNVTNMSSMFDSAGLHATDFNLNLSGWNTGNVTDMSQMFYQAGYSATTWSIGDLSGWDTSNVTDMNGMFYDAGRVATTWDIGNLNYVDEGHKGWDVSKVTSHNDFVNYMWIDFGIQTNVDLSKLPWQSD
ncbi:BspA family leucine-rich repeat surface protein [Candidatus Saccharibacteria bacterium]|nr:BspA family leucine-rich repeat surface protein [Candidatus Saccharibacteria bacterium]